MPSTAPAAAYPAQLAGASAAPLLGGPGTYGAGPGAAPPTGAPNLWARMPANQAAANDPNTGVPQYNPQTSSAILGPAPAQAGPPPAGGVGIDGFGPVMSNYLRAFNASIAASRANINTQLAGALGELGQRRDAAAKVVAGLPADIAANTATGVGALGAAANGAAAGLAPGAAQYSGPSVGQLQGDLVAAGSGATGAAASDQLANMANYQSGETALKQQAFAGNQALDDSQRAYLQQLQLKQLDGIQAQQQARQANDTYAAHAAIDDKYRRSDAAYNADQQTRATNDQAAKAAGLDNAAELDQLQSSPAYRFAIDAMTTGLYRPTQGAQKGGILSQNDGPLKQVKMSGADVAKMYAGSNPKLVYALLAGGHLSLADVVAAGLAAPAPAPVK